MSLESNELGEDATTPVSDRFEIEIKKTSDKYSALVKLLDDKNIAIPFNDTTTGFQLLNHICRQIKVNECSYFGLCWEDPNSVIKSICWLDMDKLAKKQLKGKVLKNSINFAVKFYHSDPAQIEDEETRHQIVLQLRQTIAAGFLSCSFVTYALLGSFVVQYELGDYDGAKMIGNYIKKFNFAPNQTNDLETRIMELHQNHVGQAKVNAEIGYLECARKLPFYGVDLYSAQDMDGVNLKIGICWSGVLIFRDQVRINRFAWPRIVKISYSRVKFVLQIRPLDGDVHDSVVSFKLCTISSAKNLWKICIQHHQFFRVN